jgi:hypothetical protein
MTSSATDYEVYGTPPEHRFDKLPHILWKSLWTTFNQRPEVFDLLGLLAECTRERRALKLFTNICLHT